MTSLSEALSSPPHTIALPPPSYPPPLHPILSHLFCFCPFRVGILFVLRQVITLVSSYRSFSFVFLVFLFFSCFIFFLSSPRSSLPLAFLTSHPSCRHLLCSRRALWMTPCIINTVIGIHSWPHADGAANIDVETVCHYQVRQINCLWRWMVLRGKRWWYRSPPKIGSALVMSAFISFFESRAWAMRWLRVLLPGPSRGPLRNSSDASPPRPRGATRLGPCSVSTRK